jgi:antirestriction protein ArdC
MNKVYQIVTDRLIKMLENGVVPWRCPWTGGIPMNYISKRHYSGINILLLGMLNYKFPYFLSRKQVYSLNGQINPGERSNLVIFYRPFKKKVMNMHVVEETELVTRYVLRYYSVYNIEQTTIKLPQSNHFNKINICEQIIDGMPLKPTVVSKHQKAYYLPIKDVVNMPELNSFRNPESYYSTLFHELIHSTGHQTRLNRNTITASHAFGDELYSEEELIAEIGSAFLSAQSGISNHTIDNSAAYIEGWLNILKRDSTFIFKCSRKAKDAVEFILNNSGESPGYYSLLIYHKYTLHMGSV